MSELEAVQPGTSSLRTQEGERSQKDEDQLSKRWEILLLFPYLHKRLPFISFYPYILLSKLAISNYNIHFSKLCFHSPYAVNIHKPNETAFLFWCHALWNLGSSNCCIFKMKRSTGVETCTKIYFLIIFNLVKIRIRKILLSWLYNLMTSLWKSSTRNQEIGFWELIKWSPKRKCFFFYQSFSTTYC